MSRAGKAAIFAVGAVVLLSGCGERSEAVKDCEQRILMKLRSPATYKAVSINEFPPLGDEPLYQVFINYDADNAFGVPIRGIEQCKYAMSTNGGVDLSSYVNGIEEIDRQVADEVAKIENDVMAVMEEEQQSPRSDRDDRRQQIIDDTMADVDAAIAAGEEAGRRSSEAYERAVEQAARDADADRARLGL